MPQRRESMLNLGLLCRSIEFCHGIVRICRSQIFRFVVFTLSSFSLCRRTEFIRVYFLVVEIFVSSIY